MTPTSSSANGDTVEDLEESPKVPFEQNPIDVEVEVINTEDEQSSRWDTDLRYVAYCHSTST